MLGKTTVLAKEVTYEEAKQKVNAFRNGLTARDKKVITGAAIPSKQNLGSRDESENLPLLYAPYDTEYWLSNDTGNKHKDVAAHETPETSSVGKRMRCASETYNLFKTQYTDRQYINEARYLGNDVCLSKATISGGRAVDYVANGAECPTNTVSDTLLWKVRFNGPSKRVYRLGPSDHQPNAYGVATVTHGNSDGFSIGNYDKNYWAVYDTDGATAVLQSTISKAFGGTNSSQFRWYKRSDGSNVTQFQNSTVTLQTGDYFTTDTQYFGVGCGVVTQAGTNGTLMYDYSLCFDNKGPQSDTIDVQKDDRLNAFGSVTN